MGSQPDYSQPPLQASFAGFLWDMDGTIIDSTPAIVKHWHTIGNEIGVDPETILATSHGRRSIDTLKILAPERANWEYVAKMEGQLPVLYADLATEIPGARQLLDGMIKVAAPWAIVTSGTEPLVHGWLGRMDLAVPEHLVTAESVPEGKPDPAVIGLVTSHTAEQVVAAEPDWVVKDLTSVRVVGSEDGKIVVEIKDGLKL
ncbi:hypothetical protein LLEC1_05940 [Akanthomyces lecanii]|uniref:Glycerol-3-phosphate phosphatase n=1 Tax=Cordyceps confragosa TaxID=2714763 RepID=A0A179IBS6_CORDF|nr:hypothetical protein LLEC1_05940 [Akanthomyces lecanii]